jgi:hypothetical protein
MINSTNTSNTIDSKLSQDINNPSDSVSLTNSFAKPSSHSSSSKVQKLTLQNSSQQSIRNMSTASFRYL